MVTVEQLANMIDHTNLKAFADDTAFEKLCDEAKKYNFKMVAINPAQTVRCKKKLDVRFLKQKMRLKKGQMKSIM